MPFDGAPNRLRVSQGKRFDWKRDFEFYPVQRLDAAANVFFERELVHMIPQIFMTEYAKINARSIFPVYFANDPGAETITYRQTTEYGDAEITHDYANDAPLADVESAEFDTKVRSIRSAAQWSIQEIRAAAKAGRAGMLDRAKAESARDAMLRKENEIAFLGDEDFGLVGLFSDETITGIPRDSAADTIANNTADENLALLHDTANDIPADTEDIEAPDTLLLPGRQYDRIAVQRIGPDTGDTVLAQFLRTSPHIRNVVRVRELRGIGTGGVDAMVLFKRDITKLRMNVALDLEQFAPERRGMVVKVEYHMRVGGLTVHRPQSIRIVEGV